MQYVAECAVCLRRVRLYYAVNPATGKPVWVCKRCESQWAKARRMAKVGV